LTKLAVPEPEIRKQIRHQIWIENELGIELIAST
jgi:hypothetical protein